MKILIVAHLDDEILWFNPFYFDKIYIAFFERDDKPEMNLARLNAIEKHPLKHKISMLKIKESGFWKDKQRYNQYKESKYDLDREISTIFANNTVSEIFTHNPWGEYGHSDHILVNEVVHNIAKSCCPIWQPIKAVGVEPISPQFDKMIKQPINIEQFRIIRDIYRSCNAWTWNLKYEPQYEEMYFSRNFI